MLFCSIYKYLQFKSSLPEFLLLIIKDVEISILSCRGLAFNFLSVRITVRVSGRRTLDQLLLPTDPIY